MRVSICVPAYERPEMMRQLVASVRQQTYRPIELVISDDSQRDAVKHAVETSRGDLEVAYSQNRPGLGYALNLRKAILSASGDLIVVLGDDDLFASSHAVARYVEAFTRHPSVGYAYSNQAQIAENLAVDKILRFYGEDRIFPAGADAFKHIWTTSVFIPGMAFRNTPELARWYPKDVMLFPQMELVGNIIARYDAIGLSDVLIAGRAHEDQLGFYAIKGDRIVGSERHGVVESRDILDRLIKTYDLPLTSDFLERQMVDAFSVSMLKEAIVVGKGPARSNCEAFYAFSQIARSSRRLRLSYLLLQIAPVWALQLLRRATLSIEKLRAPAEFSAMSANVKRMAGVGPI
jgi:glycosyltransferase involved in cell wall biosynthesis